MSTEIYRHTKFKEIPTFYRYKNKPNMITPAMLSLEEDLGKFRDEVILCKECAAEVMALTNMSLWFPIEVYAIRDIKFDSDYVNLYVKPDCFDVLDYETRNGYYCTTAEQTIRDLLDDFDNTNDECFIASLANYFNVNNSWLPLESTLNENQLLLLNKFKKVAENYYSY